MTTTTRTETSTFTESRARTVFSKIYADIVALEMRGFITKADSAEWQEILLYALSKNALTKYQICLTKPDSSKEAFIYVVSDDGSISGNDASGGINFHAYPETTSASILISRKESLNSDQNWLDLLKKHGWVSGGKYLEGTVIKEKSFSKDGFGITRSRVVQ